MSRVTKRSTSGKLWVYIFVLSLATALCMGMLVGYGEITGVFPGHNQQSALSVVGNIYESMQAGTRFFGLSAQTGEVTFATQDRTREEIAEAYAKYSSVVLTSTYLYKEDPRQSEPFMPGKLVDDIMQSGINRINLYRYLAGLPEVTHTEELDEKAQIGALLLALSDYSHTPAQPEGFPYDLYSIGFDTTDTSNIDSKRLISPYVLDESVDRMIADSGDINVMDIGHRRWFLFPQLGKIGMGGVLNGEWMMTVFKVTDHNDELRLSMRNDIATPAAVAWPPAGYCPTDLISREDPWSVSISPVLYDRTRTDGITVRVTSLNSGEVYDFTEVSNEPQPTLFSINTQGIGTSFCLIFRTETIIGYSEGDSYEVEINGLTPIGDMPSTIKYTVTFIDI